MGRISEEGKLRVEELYAAHAQGAVRLAYLLVGNQEVAQDIAQEAFLRAFGRFADMRKPDSFPYYLKATIVNLTRKHFRRRSLERLYERARCRMKRHPMSSSARSWLKRCSRSPSANVPRSFSTITKTSLNTKLPTCSVSQSKRRDP